MPQKSLKFIKNINVVCIHILFEKSEKRSHVTIKIWMWTHERAFTKDVLSKHWYQLRNKMF
jgi:hypothetical protein